MKGNLPETLAHIAVRLGSIATDQCLALSVCNSEDSLKNTSERKATKSTRFR